MGTIWVFYGPRIRILGSYLLEKRSGVARIAHLRVVGLHWVARRDVFDRVWRCGIRIDSRCLGMCRSSSYG